MMWVCRGGGELASIAFLHSCLHLNDHCASPPPASVMNSYVVFEYIAIYSLADYIHEHVYNWALHFSGENKKVSAKMNIAGSLLKLWSHLGCHGVMGHNHPHLKWLPIVQG